MGPGALGGRQDPTYSSPVRPQAGSPSPPGPLPLNSSICNSAHFAWVFPRLNEIIERRAPAEYFFKRHHLMVSLSSSAVTEEKRSLSRTLTLGGLSPPNTPI